MKVKGRFDHFNINVTNLEKSIQFYETALGLHEASRKEASDGSFILVYLTDDCTSFMLELTWLRDHTEAYELGETKVICVCVLKATTMRYVNSIRKWVAFALRTKQWDFISSTTRMITGLKYFP